MDNLLEKNNIEVTNNCETNSCSDQTVSCCQLPAPQYDNYIEVRERAYNERKVVQDNEKLYKDFRKDFNPLLWGFSGLIIGTVFGIVLEKILAVGADVV